MEECNSSSFHFNQLESFQGHHPANTMAQDPSKEMASSLPQIERTWKIAYSPTQDAVYRYVGDEGDDQYSVHDDNVSKGQKEIPCLTKQRCPYWSFNFFNTFLIAVDSCDAILAETKNDS
jgi:hypothetical protein